MFVACLHTLTQTLLSANQSARTILVIKVPKGRTIRKLVGGAGEVQKKYSRKGKLTEKKFVHAN